MSGGSSTRRWPSEGFDADRRASFLRRFEDAYKAPFPPPDEETLAGGLVQHHRRPHLQSLRSPGRRLHGRRRLRLVAAGGRRMRASCWRRARSTRSLVGGVDLSLDPFELVGFARNGALSTT